MTLDLAARVVIHDLLDRMQQPVTRLLRLALARISSPQVPVWGTAPLMLVALTESAFNRLEL